MIFKKGSRSRSRNFNFEYYWKRTWAFHSGKRTTVQYEFLEFSGEIGCFLSMTVFEY